MQMGTHSVELVGLGLDAVLLGDLLSLLIARVAVVYSNA